MAIADIHYGYEVNRSKQGAMLPDWGNEICRESLLALLADHQPAELVLVGDIMDGAAATQAVAELLAELQTRVERLILVEGNHDRALVRQGWPFTQSHHSGSFLFHHGHLAIALPTDGEPSLQAITITGHVHPALILTDGAGLKLRLPAFIRQQTAADSQHWILPAFSPWAAGGVYRSDHPRLATWACSQNRIWQHE